MSDFKVHSNYEPSGDQPQSIAALSEGIRQNLKHQVLLGITGSGKTFTMAKVIEAVNKPTLILSHNKTLAAQLYGEFKTLLPDNAVEFFISYYDYYQPEAYIPLTDTFIEKDSSIDDEINRLRLRATAALMSRKDVVIVASVSCIFGIGDPEDYKGMLVHIETGKSVDLKPTLRQLVDIHYGRNDLVLEPGSFRLRGDVLEIFPAYEEKAIRIELFGDEVESIHLFDPLTGELQVKLKEVFVFPAKHFVTSRENLNRATNAIREELSDRLNELRRDENLLEAQRLQQRTLFDLEMMAELGYCSGIENYSRHLDGRNPGERPSTLMDFFPDDYLVFVDESHVSLPQIRGMYKGDRSRKQTLVEYGFRLPSALDNRPMKFPEFEETVNQIVYVSATPSDYELEQTGGVFVEQIIRPTGLLDPKIVVKPTKGQIDDLIGEINKVVARKQRVLITTLTKRMAEDLTEYLEGVNINARYIHHKTETVERIKILRALRLGEFDVLVGINLLREGLDLPEVSMVIVLDADKEGFLRSKSTLMQVAGRAARNVDGRVIFYADRITKSMKFVIDETNRRRKMQIAYNKEHGIKPKTIYKSIEDIRLSTAVADEQAEYIEEGELDIPIESLDDLEAKELYEKVRRDMLRCARDLQFEQAALLRDKLLQIKDKYGIETNEVI